MIFYVATCMKHRDPYKITKRIVFRSLAKLKDALKAVEYFDTEWDIRYYDVEAGVQLVHQCIQDFDSIPCAEGPIRAVITERGRFEAPELSSR